MSELAQAIEEMRNMRESYDQLAGAADAYNEGKPALAEAITAKGVETAATDSLATMAEKVMTISQDSYEIDGGEMYAKQLFGVANNDIVPGYWNLYDIMAQLLSDGRLVNYGGILLAEYYKGYDSLALAGAGAGGAYVVSDLDENGQFKMYTEDTTHTWNKEPDGKIDRWVAFCFFDENHDFQITDTGTSPRSIHIGRKVGNISCLVDTRVSEIVVTDGNSFGSFLAGAYTSNWSKKIVLRNIISQNGALLRQPNAATIYVSADTISGLLVNLAGADNSLTNITIQARVIDSLAVFNNGTTTTSLLNSITIDGVENCINNVRIVNAGGDFERMGFPALKELHITNTEDFSMYFNPLEGKITNLTYCYLGYKTNDRTKSFIFTRLGYDRVLIEDCELKAGWCKPLNVSVFTHLTEENIVIHILNRLGDNTGQSAITITLGATNLAKLTEEEKAIATNKGFILA